MKKLVSGAVALALALTMAPAMAAGTAAAPTNDKLIVDGVVQNPTVYKIGGSNYFKIRDLAAILNGTSKQFAVGYDDASKSVTATTGQGYAKTDSDLTGPPAGGNKTAVLSNDVIYVNGVRTQAEVYKIDGSNYFKLRDLSEALGFDVGWTAEQGMFIETEETPAPVTTTKPDGAIGGQYDVSVYTVPADANKDGWLTQAEVEARIEELKVQYPGGTKWNDATIWGTNQTAADGYIGNDGYHVYSSVAFRKVLGATGGGCVAWSFLLSDQIFGDLPVREISNAYLMHAGDVIWSKESGHWSVFIKQHATSSDYYVVSDAGTSLSTTIGWGRGPMSYGEDTQDLVVSGTAVIFTRYPAE